MEKYWVVLIRTVLFRWSPSGLLGAGVFGDGFRALGDCVFGKFTRQKQTDGRLDFAAADRGAFVVVCQTRRLACDPFEHIVDKRVHDAHCLARNSSVGVDLLQYFVDVDAEAFLSLRSALLLVAFRRLLLA